ncbi:tRNA isopentenyl-2-thiomethyl-A-37 hydroxylase MiaE [Hydrotalea sp.]|uniref:tRNA isopentenyl-2-thiomethyl-A-37 hydroxylase MiaE n=1 Tax=Hydrotalea sp. TaxID=2881279 RepID=UPI00343CE23D
MSRCKINFKTAAPRWINLASISIGAILTDHAYCEQKAAISCISFIQHYSSKKEIVHRFYSP